MEFQIFEIHVIEFFIMLKDIFIKESCSIVFYFLIFLFFLEQDMFSIIIKKRKHYIIEKAKKTFMSLFLSKLKNSVNTSQNLSLLLIITYQLEIIFSILIGTDFQFFTKFSIIFSSYYPNLDHILISIFVCQLIFGVLIFVAILIPESFFIKNKNIQKLTVFFIKLYKYLGMVPIFSICFNEICHIRYISMSIISGVNILFGIFFCYYQQIASICYRFKVKDYCQKINSTLPTFIFVLIILLTKAAYGSKYAAIILIIKNIFRLEKLRTFYELPFIQHTLIFSSLYQIILALVILAFGFFNYPFNNISLICFIALFGGFIVNNVSKDLSVYLFKKMISESSMMFTHDQNNIVPQNHQDMIMKYQNQIRTLAMIYLQKVEYSKGQSNTFDKWWTLFNRIVMLHKINCNSLKCRCSKQKLSQTSQEKIFLKELINNVRQLQNFYGKQMKLKIMSIYLYIQLAHRPLKAYYELMKIKIQKKTEDFDDQLDNLTTETRECFDQVFLKNKVKNQKLQLMKVMQLQQLITEGQQDLKKIISQTIQFYSIFNHHTIKISKIKQQSNKLQSLKNNFQKRIQKIVNQYSSNLKLNIMIHFFYNYLEVYQNKQSEFKKLTHKQLIKKRLYEKKEINVFNEQYGTIFIDLVEERGKIKNITKNVCTMFGYPKEDMQNYNINLFMPKIFGKNHAKFLTNFIQHGRIKLLTQTTKDVFGRNKQKFIFPISICLKAQYLHQNQFGSSGLIKCRQTNFQYILVDMKGKIQQMTEGIYRKSFAYAFKEQNLKTNRLHINKIIPSFNNQFQNAQCGKRYDKIVQGHLIFCQNDTYFLEKFKFLRDLTKVGRSLANRSNNTNSISMTISQYGTDHTQNMSNQEMCVYLNEIMKIFLCDIDLFQLSALKITYKVTRLVTAQFEAQLIQILNVKENMPKRQLFQGILNQFNSLVQIFKLNQDDHTLIFNHLKNLQSLIDSQEFSTKNAKTASSQQNNSLNELDLIGKLAPRYQKNILSKDFSSIEFQEKNKLFGEENDFQKKSEMSSVFGLDEGQSKRQILINAFNKNQKVLNSNVMSIVIASISSLVLFQICFFIVDINFFKQMENEWKSFQFVEQIHQTIQYRNSLIQIEKYEHISKIDPPSFVKQQKNKLNDQFKNKVQRIVEEGLNPKYVQKFIISNLDTTQQEEMTLIQVIQQLLWRYFYESSRNIDQIRNTYESIHMAFQKFKEIHAGNLLMKQKNNALVSFVLNGVYIFCIFILIVGAGPIFVSFKKQEQKLTQLIQYVSFKDIKKSMQKLQLVQMRMIKIDKIQTLRYIKAQMIEDKQLSLLKGNQNQINVLSKHMRIVPDTQNSSSHMVKLIFIALILFLFLTNISIIMIALRRSSNQTFQQSMEISMNFFEMQNKPAYLLNIYLLNFNNILVDQSDLQFHISTQKLVLQNYFETQRLSSSEKYINNAISKILRQKINIEICHLIECPTNQTKNIGLDYLIYKFKSKFQFLSSQNRLNQSIEKLEQWKQENQISQIIPWMGKVIELANLINQEISSEYVQQINTTLTYLMIVGGFLIPINAVLLMLIHHYSFKSLNGKLKQAKNIYRHFDIETLSQNTYLTTYFNSKLKESK